MLKAADLHLNAGDDLEIVNGDFVIDFSDSKHIEHIVSAYPGYYRESLLTGVGIGSYLKSSGAAPEVQRKTAVQLEADNYLLNIVEAKYTPTVKLTIDAERLR